MGSDAIVMSETCQGDNQSGCGCPVFINVYNINALVELLNWLVLREHEMPIFHCGVEIHDHEFSFVHFGCESDDHSQVRGAVVSSEPKLFPQYKFCESIVAGSTDLSLDEIEEVIIVLARAWSADPYHPTRHNCLLFAEALVEQLGLGHNYPAWLKNVCVTASQTPGLASFVDSCWEITKWQRGASQGTHNYPHTMAKCHMRVDCYPIYHICFSGHPLSDKLAECSACGRTDQAETSLFTAGSHDLITIENADESVICHTTFNEYDIPALEMKADQEFCAQFDDINQDEVRF